MSLASLEAKETRQVQVLQSADPPRFPIASSWGLHEHVPEQQGHGGQAEG